jgi:hypothetical protein
VSLEPGASLKDYWFFAVAPVTDETGYPFSFSITDSLRERLVERLRSHGLPVVPLDAPTDPAAPALVITSTLQAFKGGGMVLKLPGRGVTACVLRSELTDKRTGRRIGEIVASDVAEGAQGVAPFQILMGCARMVADEIHRQLRRRE